MKTQAVQVEEREEEEKQISAMGPNRPDYQRTVEEECLRKETFFINHYYLHLIGQCCCQQHNVMVKKGEAILQSGIPLTYDRNENSHKLQQMNKIKTNTNVMKPLNYNTWINKNKRCHKENKSLYNRTQITSCATSSAKSDEQQISTCDRYNHSTSINDQE